MENAGLFGWYLITGIVSTIIVIRWEHMIPMTKYKMFTLGLAVLSVLLVWPVILVAAVIKDLRSHIN